MIRYSPYSINVRSKESVPRNHIRAITFTIIEQTTGGNVNEFVRRCRRMDPDAAPTYSAVRKYLAGGIPGINKAAVMAAVGNVSLQWLARGTEAPKAPIVPEGR